MSKERIEFTANAFVDQDSKEIASIAQKRGILFPSDHLGFFKTKFAKIEEPNNNGVRLERTATIEALPTLIGAQVNFSHLQAGFIMGTILDAWINAETDEIEVVYSFFKEVYPMEYTESVELAERGELSVSFELLSERSTQEHIGDGTVRLHDITFTGMGHLMAERPAYPNAKVFEFAQEVKDRVSKCNNKELIYASTIIEQCDEILSQDDMFKEPMIFLTTSVDDDHWHVALVDSSGNGQTISGHGEGKHEEPHAVVNWQFQIARNADESTGTHTHRTRDEILATVKEHVEAIKKDMESRKLTKTEEKSSMELTQEQKDKVEALRAELGDVAKDVSDEDLLKDERVDELRQAKEDSKNADDESDDDAGDAGDDEKGDEGDEGKEEAKTDLEKAEDRITELEAENETLKSTLEAKDSEVDEVKANAEKVGQRKVELKDNEFAKDFEDADYLDDEKVAKAIQDQKDAETIAERKEELKDNKYAQDFEDKDYLDDSKVELAKVKAENDSLKVEGDKEEKNASDEEEAGKTGAGEEAEGAEDPYEEVMASVREQKNEQGTGIKVFKKDK